MTLRMCLFCIVIFGFSLFEGFLMKDVLNLFIKSFFTNSRGDFTYFYTRGSLPLSFNTLYVVHFTLFLNSLFEFYVISLNLDVILFSDSKYDFYYLSHYIFCVNYSRGTYVVITQFHFTVSLHSLIHK